MVSGRLFRLSGPQQFEKYPKSSGPGEGQCLNPYIRGRRFRRDCQRTLPKIWL